MKWINKSFLLLAIQVLLVINFFVSTAQSQSFSQNLSGSVWEGTIETTLNTGDVWNYSFKLFFEEKGKVKIAFLSNISGLQPQAQYNGATGNYDSRLVFMLKSSISGGVEGIYRQSGRSFVIECPDYNVNASINGNVIEGDINLKSSNDKAKWTAKRISEGSKNPSSSQKPSGEIQRIWVDYDVYEEQKKGLRIHINFIVRNMKDKTGEICVYFYYASGEALKDYNGHYKTLDGKVAMNVNFIPNYESSSYKDLQIFMPYDEFHMNKGKYTLKFNVNLYSEDSGFFAQSEDYTFKYSKLK